MVSIVGAGSSFAGQYAAVAVSRYEISRFLKKLFADARS
jgi:hypothetical protein